jgi:hypothetical protein
MIYLTKRSEVVVVPAGSDLTMHDGQAFDDEYSSSSSSLQSPATSRHSSLQYTL